MTMLYTQRLLLREFREADVEPLYAIQGNPAYMRFTHVAVSHADCAAWLRGYADSRAVHGFAPWTVVQRTTAEVIGWGGLVIDPFAPGWGVEVSYFIHPACAGQGYATELVHAAVHHGFADLDLDRIGAFARPENLASIRVLTKCGFAFLGYEPALARNHYELARRVWQGAAERST